jgi:hypothetical protein
MIVRRKVSATGVRVTRLESKPKDLSSNPQKPCKKPGTAHMLSQKYRWAETGLCGLTGWQISSSLSERPRLKGVERVMSLYFIWASHMPHTCTHIHAHIHRDTQTCTQHIYYIHFQIHLWMNILIAFFKRTRNMSLCLFFSLNCVVWYWMASFLYDHFFLGLFL